MNALQRVSGPLDAAGCSFTFELVPVRESLKSCPFANSECAGLLEVDIVVR